MLLYLARATPVMDLEIHSSHAYLDNAAALHASLDSAKIALSIALMHEARKWIASAPTELDIIWDEPINARCVAASTLTATRGYGWKPRSGKQAK